MPVLEGLKPYLGLYLHRETEDLILSSAVWRA